MYLEISLPHSGKTTRLILAVTKALEKQLKVLNIITGLPRKDFLHKYSELNPVKNLLIISEQADLSLPPECRFFDNFDYLQNIIVNPNSFYSTSLKYYRGDGSVKEWLAGKRQDYLLSLMVLAPKIHHYKTFDNYSQIVPNSFRRQTSQNKALFTKSQFAGMKMAGIDFFEEG